MPNRRRLKRAHLRAGLSVIEVLCALVLVSVGLLGMAGTSALALRSAGTASREHRAARIASTRIALLQAAGCSKAGSGVMLEDAAGATERWVVGTVHNSAAPVDVEVGWREGTKARTLVLHTALLC